MVDTFDFLSYFSGLKPNLIKFEIAGKGVQVTVCGVRCIDLNNLNNNTLKILGTNIFYNKKLKKEKTI